MQTKVEICGVNTSKLIVLKNAETLALIEKAKGGSKAARDKLVEGELRLLLSVLQRFTGRGEPSDDLFQIACIGMSTETCTKSSFSFFNIKQIQS